jgi:hypothetical protein
MATGSRKSDSRVADCLRSYAAPGAARAAEPRRCSGVPVAAPRNLPPTASDYAELSTGTRPVDQGGAEITLS